MKKSPKVSGYYISLGGEKAQSHTRWLCWWEPFICMVQHKQVSDLSFRNYPRCLFFISFESRLVCELYHGSLRKGSGDLLYLYKVIVAGSQSSLSLRDVDLDAIPALCGRILAERSSSLGACLEEPPPRFQPLTIAQL